MLLRYIVSNYKSIGHAAEFSMFPAEDSTDQRFKKRITTRAGNWDIMQRGGFFGPNASGKTSFVKSIGFAKDFIVNGRKSGKGTGVDQFRGNLSELKGISNFQFLIYQDGEVYEYGFSIDRRQVHEEWFMQLTSNGFSQLFTRWTDGNGKTKINIGASLAKKGSRSRDVAEVLKDGMGQNQKNQLFISKLSENGVKKAERLVAWFNNLYVIYPESKIRALPLQMKEDEELRDYIADMLGRMDTGVHDITVASDEMDFLDFARKTNIPKELIDEIEGMRAGILTIDGNYFVFSENEKMKTTLIQLKFQHRLNGKSYLFNLDDESDGTQRLLDLLPMLFLMQRESAVFFVDEIDRSLHTKLAQMLMDEFAACEAAGNNQLIFTAHDVNLINLEHFRQDELWFVEKTSRGETTLRPLSDFKIAAGQDAVKAYLNGRFGAIPVIRGNTQ